MKNKIEELKIELTEMEDHYAFDPTDQDLHEDIIILQAQLKELEETVAEKVNNIQEKYPIIRKLFPNEVERIEQGRCPFCNKEINKEEFRNEISLKEFKISGICQKCQDDFFGTN